MGKKRDNEQKSAPPATTKRQLKPEKTASLGNPVGDFNISMITSLYGLRKHPRHKTMEFHPGIDIDTEMGEAVLSVADGVIIFSGKQGGYGNVIIVEHSEEFCTVYAHLALMVVTKGDVVHRGELIGNVGVTGNSTGSHLHFEVRINGKTVDPLDYLKISK
ncbi:MAG: M23 family metallopeptidase [Candidatus Krumholzibacteria bacterium]|nr:M23 family metallopeptidase [Candidatus Krumholzibacteria bacterium]